MTITTEAGNRANEDEPPTPPSSDAPTPGGRRLRPLTIAAVASLSAGAVHSAAIGAHADHPAAARTFVAVTLLQLAWGSWALVQRTRTVALVGVILNGALFGGWVLAKWQGLSFISGLDKVEPVQFADALCAGLALVSALAAAAVFLRFRVPRPHPRLAVATAAVLAVLALPGMVEAGRHVHAGTRVGFQTQVKIVKGTSAVPIVPYDPNAPLDLRGVKGVSQSEQARAENLVADTLIRLPQWSDQKKAKAAGFTSFGHSERGFVTLTNWSFINDNKTFDPDYPEALVYQVKNGKSVLVSAVFMMKPGSNPKTLPKLGGPLTPYDINSNLCLSREGKTPHIAGVTDKGKCPDPQVKLAAVPMIHLWIVADRCGPFAWNADALGKAKPGTARVCVLSHTPGTL